MIPLEIFRAAADAEKIREFVLALSHQQEMDVTKAVNTDLIEQTDDQDLVKPMLQQSDKQEEGSMR